MIKKYKSASRLGKVFIWLSGFIVAGFIAAYISNLVTALSLEPQSFNCRFDSMMKPFCRDPFGTSLSWAIIEVVLLGWPVIVAWAIIGEVLYLRRNRRLLDARLRSAKNRDKT